MFMYFNEAQLLAARVRVLAGVVDHFVLAESTCTHAGHPKPLYPKPKGDVAAGRVTCVVYDPDPARVAAAAAATGQSEAWARENGQRDALLEGLADLHRQGLVEGDDLVMVGDLDEIPRPSVVADLVRAGSGSGSGSYFRGATMVGFEQRLFYGDFTVEACFMWNGTVMARVGALLDGTLTPQAMRNARCRVPRVLKGGWHCSYFGTPAAIVHKVRSFTHQEFNTPAHTDPATIAGRLERGEDIFGRGDAAPFRKVPLADQVDLPPFTADEVRTGGACSPPTPAVGGSLPLPPP